MIGGNFQDVHREVYNIQDTRISFSEDGVVSCLTKGWPIECWDVAFAFLYARLFRGKDQP